MASSATPLHDSLIELAIPDAHAHAIKWYLAIGGRVPEAVVTFEPREEALGAWQEVKGEAMSVNEALYGGAIEGPVRLDGS